MATANRAPSALRRISRGLALVLLIGISIAVTAASSRAASSRAASPLPAAPQQPSDEALEPDQEILLEISALVPDNLDRAAELLPRARELCEASGDPQQIYSSLVFSAAITNGLGRWHESVIWADRAIAAFERCKQQAESDPELLANLPALRLWLGEIRIVAAGGLANLGRYAEAETHYLEAIRLNRDDDGLVSRYRSDLGVTYFNLGRYEEALEQYALAIKLAASGSDPSAARIPRINRAAVFEKLGEIDLARREYEEMLTAPDLQLAEQEKLETSIGRILLRYSHDPESALDYFDRGAKLAEQMDSASTSANIALHQGFAWMERGDHATAQEYLDKARRLATRIEDARTLLFSLIYLANCSIYLRDHDAAIQFGEEAISRARASGNLEAQWDALSALARALHARGDTGEAIQRIEEAIDLIEGVRTTYVPDPNQVRFFGGEQRQDVYADAVDILLSVPDAPEDTQATARAYAVVQRARARSLLDALAASPLEADAACTELVAPNEAIIEFVITRRRVLAFIVQAGGIEFVCLEGCSHTTDPSTDLAHRVRSARRACTAPDPSELDERAMQELGRDLMRPILERLAPDVRQLTIVPDGALVSLPFAALPLGRDGTRPFLIERFDLSYAPSASTLAALRRPPVLDSAVRLAALADPRLPDLAALDSEPLGEQSRLAMLVQRHDLGPLPATRDEVEWIGNEIEGEIIVELGDGATTEAFRAIVRRRPLVLHLATHTVVDSLTANASAIVFSTAGGGFDEGLLRTAEIEALDIPSELVTLSSCRSGQGEWQRGEGVLGLARSFLAAGSRSVLCTHWRVDDSASAAFMQQVYHNLGQGVGRGAALRKAQLAFLDNPATSHPRLWAPYMIVGEARMPIYPAGATPLWPRFWQALLFGLVIGSIILIAARRRAGGRLVK